MVISLYRYRTGVYHNASNELLSSFTKNLTITIMDHRIVAVHCKPKQKEPVHNMKKNPYNKYIIFTKQNDPGSNEWVKILPLEKDGKLNESVDDFTLIMEEWSLVDMPIETRTLTDGQVLQMLVDNPNTYRYAFINKDNVQKLVDTRASYIEKYKDSEDDFDAVMQTVYEDDSYYYESLETVNSDNMFTDVPTEEFFKYVMQK